VGLALIAAGCGGSAGQSAPPPLGYCSADEAIRCGDLDTPCPPGAGVCLQNTAASALKPDEVRAIMDLAAQSLDRELVVAVTDRRGVVLGVGSNFAFDYAATCAGDCPADGTGCPAEPTAVSDRRAVDLALQLARTAAFFSADQTPLTSRAIRFLSGEHFPPGIRNAGAAALFGIENTNRGCSFDAAESPVEDLIPRPRSLCAVLNQRAEPPGPILRCDGTGGEGARCGCTAGVATIPGGVQIYKNGAMVGGIGVVLRDVAIQCDPTAAFDSTSVLRLADDNPEFALMEFAARAFAGNGTGLPNVVAHPDLRRVCASDVPPACCASGCDFNILATRQPPFAPVIFVDGIAIPEIALDPPVPPDAGTFGALTNFIVDPLSLPEDTAQPLPIGWLVSPRDSTPGAAPLSAADVQAIVAQAYDRASQIRAAIRLPLPARSQMILAVSDTNDALLGLFRMNDATVFSIDVAVAKSRNVTWFSSPDVDALDRMDCPGAGICLQRDAIPYRPTTGTAITNRTLSFGAQPFFPSGIEGSLPPYFPPPFAPGPFRSVFLYDSANACTNGQEPANGRQNGIVFFPGSVPLYRDQDSLIGGFGVSGDGVEQDDIVSYAGGRTAPGYSPRPSLRADQLKVRDVRLPYLKFNRRPEQ
jgi:uncharacterized protein GlcG (DUF336 family)